MLTHLDGFGRRHAAPVADDYYLFSDELAQSVGLDVPAISGTHVLAADDILQIVQADNSSLPTISLIQAITAAGLDGSARIVLDAGHADSYGGSGQVWADQSGNGHDFYRGSSSGSESSDPTFNGTAGSLTSGEYFAFDGSDFFRYDSANETWMNALHKDGAQFTVALLVYSVTGGFARGLVGTTAVSGPGVQLLHLGAGTLRLNVYGDSAGAVLTGITSDATVSTSAWHFVALSIDEPGGTGFFYLDGSYLQVGSSDTFSATYSSPSVNAAENTLELGAKGGGVSALGSGSRLAGSAFFDSALSKADLDDVYNAIKIRYGLA